MGMGRTPDLLGGVVTPWSSIMTPDGIPSVYDLCHGTAAPAAEVQVIDAIIGVGRPSEHPILLAGMETLTAMQLSVLLHESPAVVMHEMGVPESAVEDFRSKGDRLDLRAWPSLSDRVNVPYASGSYRYGVSRIGFDDTCTHAVFGVFVYNSLDFGINVWHMERQRSDAPWSEASRTTSQPGTHHVPSRPAD